MQKLLFIAHGHPEFSKGGGEIAAWNIFRNFFDEGMDALFLARSEDASHPGSAFSLRENNQIFYHSTLHNPFDLTNRSALSVHRELKKLVAQFQPDVIHIHHYYGIGIEVFRTLRTAAPKARIIFTIHEYWAICMHYGTMVKTDSMKLCSKSSPLDCHRCFTQYSPGDFFLRQQFVLDQFSYVDHFISPSHFLKQRYAEWGLAEEKISVIENPMRPIQKQPPRKLLKDEKRSRFAFFGQLSPFKGLDVLLSAILTMPKAQRKLVRLDIHGANLEVQADEYKKKIASLLKKCGDNVRLHGSYEAEQLPTLMAACDWVVMPSVWWENSPVVIQEAASAGRPILGSDIGGIKEKIHEKLGFTFPPKNPTALADAMLEAMNVEVFDHWQKSLQTDNNTYDLIKKVYLDA